MKRFVFAAIFAVCFVFLYSCGDDDEDSSITRLQSHLDGRLDNIEGEIDTLREDVNTLAAETKTPLTDGAIPPDPRRDLDAIREETGGLLPANAPVIGGGQIVFVVRHDDHNTLSIMNPNGTDVRVMVELHASIYHPALAPDGIGVAYTEGVFAGQRRIFVHRIDSPGRFLLGTPDGLYPAWSHDGRWIAWGDGLNIFISPSQANPNTHGGQLTHVSNNEMPTWSPDGRKIATDNQQSRR